MRSRSSSRSATGGIDKLDFDRNRKTTPDNDGSEHSGVHLLDDDESLLSDVVDGIIERDRRRMSQAVTRYLSFACAIFSCLCAGSITAYSLYGHLFLSRLHYTQLQVNIVSIAAEVSMYLPVPLFGYLCDRYSPRPLSIFSGVLFGNGYLLAAFTYHKGAPSAVGGNGWPFGVMVLAFVFVGMGTSSMYLSAVTTCAKNFGRGKHKGLALAVPIAAFGLSGMWQSQVGSRLLYEQTPDGSRGDVDVFRFFIFLAATLLVAGLLGAVILQVVDEEELIDEAVEELERSGLLEDSAFFQRSIIHDHTSYGTIDDPSRPSSEGHEHEHQRREADAKRAHEDEEMRKKTWLLNVETRRFLADPTMWFLAGGFFLVTGPGEAFINNLGTIIGTLYPPPLAAPPSNSAATHVSIVAITSTLARLLTGTLSDLLAPTLPPNHQYHSQRPPSSSSTTSSLRSFAKTPRFSLSRLTFLFTSTVLLSLGQLLLASGAIQARPRFFPLVSALIGTGYGAVFSLTPIIVSVVWGVENFGTNWGIVAMVPAAGATVWGVLYSAVYQWGAQRNTRNVAGGEEVLCYGKSCYEGTFWAMVACSWVACGLWGWAWRGKDGWMRRGVAV